MHLPPTHTVYSTKLINALSKAAKLEWGLKYGALRTIYNGAILPFLSYAAPSTYLEQSVDEEVQSEENNKGAMHDEH